jgi:hypothetical protein
LKFFLSLELGGWGGGLINLCEDITKIFPRSLAGGPTEQQRKGNVPSSTLCARQSSSIRGGIFKLLRTPGIDSKESISPAYVALRAASTTLFLAPIDCYKIPAQESCLWIENNLWIEHSLWLEHSLWKEHSLWIDHSLWIEHSLWREHMQFMDRT